MNVVEADVAVPGEPADVEVEGECEEEEEQCVFCPGRIVRVVESGSGPVGLVGVYGEVLDREESGNVAVMFSDWLGGEQLLHETQLAATPWHRALSNSTSPGDHYWYNYDSGDSVWEEPSEVKNIKTPASTAASTPTETTTDTATAQASNVTSCTSSDYDAEPQTTTKKRSLVPDAAPARSKEEELSQLRQRLLELERAKKRKLNKDAEERPAASQIQTQIQSHQAQQPTEEVPDAAKDSAGSPAQDPEYTGKANVEVVLQSRTVLDQRLNALLPKEHGLKAIPHLSVPLVD